MIGSFKRMGKLINLGESKKLFLGVEKNIWCEFDLLGSPGWSLLDYCYCCTPYIHHLGFYLNYTPVIRTGIETMKISCYKRNQSEDGVFLQM